MVTGPIYDYNHRRTGDIAKTQVNLVATKCAECSVCSVRLTCLKGRGFSNGGFFYCSFSIIRPFKALKKLKSKSNRSTTNNNNNNKHATKDTVYQLARFILKERRTRLPAMLA